MSTSSGIKQTYRCQIDLPELFDPTSALRSIRLGVCAG